MSSVRESRENLMNRISTAPWIQLVDAFIYACIRLNNAEMAKLELSEKLEKGEIRSRAVLFRTFNADNEELIRKDKWADIPCTFWDGAIVNWTGHGRSQTRSNSDGFLYEAQQITIKTEDIFRIWPVAEPPVKSNTSTLVRSPQSKLTFTTDELKEFLLKTVNIDMTESQAKAAAKSAFPHLSIPDKARWRPAWKAVESQRRGRGDNANTLKSKFNK